MIYGCVVFFFIISSSEKVTLKSLNLVWLKYEIDWFSPSWRTGSKQRHTHTHLKGCSLLCKEKTCVENTDDEGVVSQGGWLTDQDRHHQTLHGGQRLVFPLARPLSDDATDKTIRGRPTAPLVYWPVKAIFRKYTTSRNVLALESWLQAVSSSYHAKPESHKYWPVQGEKLEKPFGRCFTCFTTCVGVRNIHTFL